MDTPLCDCHGEPKRWRNSPRYKAGGYWRCAVRMRTAQGRRDLRYRTKRSIRKADRNIAKYQEQLRLVAEGHTVEEARQRVRR